MVKVAGSLTLIILISALLVHSKYAGFKAIESRSKSMLYPFYLRIAIRSAVLILGLILLWKGEFARFWSIAGLIYILCSIIIFILISRKVEAWRKSQENK